MDLTRAEITEIIEETVAAATKGHECRFTLTDAEAKAISSHVEEMRELGKGDIIMAMRTVRDNHSFIADIRQRGDKISSVMFWSFIAACGGGVAYGGWKALKILVQQIFIEGR